MRTGAAGLALLAIAALGGAAGAEPPEPRPPDRLRIGSFGPVVLEVVDGDGRVAGCSLEPLLTGLPAERIPGSRCEADPAIEERCPQVVGTVAVLPPGRYEVRVTSVLARVEALAFLEILEVTGDSVSRGVGYRLELPPGARSVITFEPGTTPAAEILREDRPAAVVEATEWAAPRARDDVLSPGEAAEVCAAAGREPEPTEEEAYERFLRRLPPSMAAEIRRETLQRALLGAVRAGRVGEVRERLAEGAEADGTVDSGPPALLLAAGAGDREIVELLLDAGAEPGRRWRRDDTALARTYEHDHSEIAELLLARGAEPEPHLLLRSIRDGRTAWTELLRRAGAAVAPDALLRLMESAYREAPESAETVALAGRALDLLLEADDWRRLERRLLELTVCRADPSAARRLVDGGADLDASGRSGTPPREGSTLLHQAVAEHRPECVERLLAWGADADPADAYGLTPLMIAVRARDVALADRMLRAGGDPGARTADGRTPLVLLAERPITGAPERRDRLVADERTLVSALTAAGADVDARTAGGESALLAAARQAKLGLVEDLLDHGATLTAGDWEAMAALHGEAWRIDLERLWRERELPVPSLVELFPPAPMEDGDARAQQRTMRDLRLLGQALTAWLTDQVGAASASATTRVAGYRRVTVAELEAMLTPHYLSTIPSEDGWGHPFELRVNGVSEAIAGGPFFLLRSPGRDGRFSTDVYTYGAFPAASYDSDIVMIDGRFVRWPR